MTKTVSSIVDNHSDLSKHDIVKYTDQKLLPYDRHLLLQVIGDFIYKGIHEEFPHYNPDYDYIGAEPSCTFEPLAPGIFTEQFTPPFV